MSKSRKLSLTDEEIKVLALVFGEGWSSFDSGHDTYARENKPLLSQEAAKSLKKKSINLKNKKGTRQ